MVDASIPPVFRDSRPLDPLRATMRVLLAEDDAEMRSLLAQVLRRAGYHVWETDGGDAAIAALTDREWFPWLPDVVLSDVCMPGSDGLAVARTIHSAGLRVPTFLMTAFGDDGLHEEASRLGVRRVFDKPFPLTQLLDALAELAPPR
ncbi:MAG TPA: response regulator [Nannocystaceae bacterium]|nr:response regulator [Nannocystaceae bacterium]